VQYATRADAAYVVGVTVRTINRWVAAGYVRSSGGLVVMDDVWRHDSERRQIALRTRIARSKGFDKSQ
jgi:hypothetical protein